MENLQDLQDQVSLIDYVEKIYGKCSNIGVNTYRLNPCPVCGGQDHFTIYTDTNSYISYNDCCKGGKILEFMQEVEEIEKNEAIKRLYILTSHSKNDKQDKQDFIRKQKIEFISNGINNQTQDNKERVYEYMTQRGMSNKIADKYHLFISDEVYEDKSRGTEGTARLVIPILDNEGQYSSYVARALETVEKVEKVLNSATEQTPLNIHYIKQQPTLTGDNTIYVCEGWADALSIEDTGKKAISLHSTSNVKRFIKEIQANMGTASQYTYILCMDNDEPGRKATTTAIEGMDSLNIKHIELKIPEDYTDVNEWYRRNPEELKMNLYPFYKDNVLNYLDTRFREDVIMNEMWGSIETGFNKLDEQLGGLYGLVVVGGPSSLGKTTLVHQMCDQIAANFGLDIIYFSLEQSRFELVAKSISRQTYLDVGYINAKKTSNIMNSSTETPIRENAIENYKQFASRIHIVEGNFKTNVNTIRNYVESYIKITGIHPVVVVDYLQILRPINDRDTDKRQVDNNMTALKQISRDNNIPVIAISSFNRENYSKPVDFTSFKESGAIEYSADIVLGLQLEVINHLSNINENDKREMINEAKASNPRDIEVVCLKNRNGIPFFKCGFKFYPQFNVFSENREKKDTF